MVRGLRGAITAHENTRESILAATRLMLRRIVDANNLDVSTIATAYFTTTPDLNAAFPAAAARQIGWDGVAMMCGHEIGVPGSLTKCVRVMLTVNSDEPFAEPFIYLRGATVLRADVPPIDGPEEEE